MPFSELLPQPQVEHPERGRIALDALLGVCFAVIGWDSAALRAHAGTLVPAGVQCNVIGLIRREDDFLPEAAPAPITRARDFTGVLGGLLARLDAVALIIRPDRYLYAAVGADQLQAADPTALRNQRGADLAIEPRR